MLSQIKPKVEPIVSVIAFPFMGIHPNILTVAGIIPPVLFFVFLVNGSKLLALLSLLGVIFDFVDGYVARKTNKTSAFGAVLDSTMDRLADGLLITAFGFAELVSWPIVVAFLISSYLISYIRSRAELAGGAKFKLDIGLLERGERILAIVVITALSAFTDISFGVLNLVEALFLLVTFLSVITVLQRLFAAYRKLRNL
jgi:phosphatidylglycerophosphate synthase